MLDVIAREAETHAAEFARMERAAATARVRELAFDLGAKCGELRGNLLLLKTLLDHEFAIEDGATVFVGADIAPEHIEAALIELAAIAHTFRAYPNDPQAARLLGSTCSVCQGKVVDVERGAPGRPRVMICEQGHRTVEAKQAKDTTREGT